MRRIGISEADDDDAAIHQWNIEQIMGEHNCSWFRAARIYVRRIRASENWH